MKYTCSCCGKEYDDWPALDFHEPAYYGELGDEEKETIAVIGTDLCVIEHQDQTDRFIKGVLYQKVNGTCQQLQYTVWVSLSEKSYNDYVENFDNHEHEATYFGYLCNWIAPYKSTLSLHTNVVVSKGNKRPEVVPHENDHPFVRDYYNGISIDEAERRMREVIKTSGGVDEIDATDEDEKPGFFSRLWAKINRDG